MKEYVCRVMVGGVAHDVVPVVDPTNFVILHE